MNQFPKDIKFKYSWRAYQERVLLELNDHLTDNHLHIIAPPGSGKTVLGLEVAIRLNKPTLILAPTIAIKNQWISRLCELFLQTENFPDWISRDIRNPKFLTVSTYQGLHSAISGEEETEEDPEEEIQADEKEKEPDSTKESVISKLLEQNIGTIVVDEAHHLKNAWWRSLTEVKESLQATVVGLTATPPYDVSYAEWHRYLELNGPVDTEISVPELVIEGNLCPHQDFVVLSTPTDEEAQKIVRYRQRIDSLIEEIKTDTAFISAIENHPIYQVPLNNLETIYSNIEYYSAILIFLHSLGKVITRTHLEVIGDTNFKIPEFTPDWMEILLSFYLYEENSFSIQYEEHQEKLKNKLKRAGVLERKSINLVYNQRINKHLKTSISKLENIQKVVDFEHEQLGDDLRMVILTDYIRKEFLVNEPHNSLVLNKIGVMSIFEKIRRENDQNLKVGVLTGSLVIIPVTAQDRFQEICKQAKISIKSFKSLPYDSQYLIIRSSEKLKHDIVRIITQVFEEGHIECLVGTKSLLGEGWDAPSINSLVLASFVGSYVLSNQMRGRAIRTNSNEPKKTSHIWHLACVDLSASNGGEDLELLKRRFKSFIGVSYDDQPNIENGIDRLKIPSNIRSKKDIEKINEAFFLQAKQRSSLKDKWALALEKGTTLIEEIKIPFPTQREYRKVKSLYYRKTIRNLTFSLLSGLGTFLLEALEGMGEFLKGTNSTENFKYYLLFIGVLGVLIFGRKTYKTMRLYIKYRDISKDIQGIGLTMVDALIKIKAIKTHRTDLEVVTDVLKNGTVFCHLEGGTTYEKSTFIGAMQEVFDTVDNPRYLIIRKGLFLQLFSQKDYHSVPDAIGRKKSFAQFFHRRWNHFVGKSELVYTRSIKGRKILLKSRVNSLASEFNNKTHRVNKWR
ncbi:DEAD/DEAH box helicase family protein [Pseudotenacibaculum haliotis]|uniref:DEAD/DEAH box helicase family protein n=1 Tax=Pseudotenacibaculum haliotis TaxID=1862138 RepID=A0ABW5LVT4_9FLAO